MGGVEFWCEPTNLLGSIFHRFPEKVDNFFGAKIKEGFPRYFLSQNCQEEKSCKGMLRHFL